MQKEIFDNRYSYEPENSKLEIASFLELEQNEYVFIKNRVVNGGVEISEDEFIKELRLYLKTYEKTTQEYVDYVEDSEALFKNPNLNSEFVTKYSSTKYNLKKFYSTISTFSNALKIASDEQIWLRKRLKLIIHEAEILVRVVKELLLKLDEIHEFINHIKQEKLTKGVYILTLVSTVFLPLNLITGFFGMNTGGLFLSQNPYGSLIVLSLIVAVLLVILLVKKIKSD